jgi:phage/plasmid-like protein (TIGR03299 family)
MSAAVENMAYAGQVPWHGLGNNIDADTPIDQWRVAAGLDWEAHMSLVHFNVGDELFYMQDKNVVYRSDNLMPLGVVGGDYKPVQPAEVLEFFRDLTELGQFRMETAGVLFNGERIWALAHHTGDAALPGGDVLKPYLLLATGMDGKFSTKASFTTVRVVCNNTLQMALRKNEDVVRVTHRDQFDEQKVKAELGLVDSKFDQFITAAESLAAKKVTSRADQLDFLANVVNPGFVNMERMEQVEYIEESQLMAGLKDAYDNFAGQQLESAKDTAWGLVNGVTAYLDHMRNTQTDDARLAGAWFGAGKAMKQRAMELALDL